MALFVSTAWSLTVGIALLVVLGLGSMFVVAKHMQSLTAVERASHEARYYRAREELIVAWKRVYVDCHRRRWGKAIWRGVGGVLLAYADFKRTTVLGVLDFAIVNLVSGVFVVVYTIDITDIVYTILQIISRFLEWITG